MKVGFLHGCRQTSDMFESLTKVYRELLSKQGNFEFIFIEGQYDYITGKTWFKTNLELSLIGTDHIPEDEIYETLNYVENIVRREEINVLVGFSQCGNIVDTYLRLKNSDSHIKSALILNGYSFPRYHKLIPIVDKFVFVFSSKDDVVRPELLHNNYQSIIKFEHDKGHKLNNSKPFVRSIIQSL